MEDQTVASSSMDRTEVDRVVELMSVLYGPAMTLDQGMELVLRGLAVVLGSPLGRAHVCGRRSDRWQSSGELLDPARRHLDGRLDVPDELRVEAVSDLSDPEAMDLLRAVGLHGVLTLPVVSEGRPIGAVQLFLPSVPLDERWARLFAVLSGQLGMIASRERLRTAVQNVAQHARTMIAAMEQLRSDSELYDSLTGLPGRLILEDRIRQSIRRRQRSSRSMFAILLLQGDRLQAVRERHGRAAADEVLLGVARRLRGLLRPADTAARDGDRFLVVLEELRVVEEAKEVADRLLRATQRPFLVGTEQVALEPALGLVFGGPAYDSVDALLGDAEVALRRARESKQRIQLFDAVCEDNEMRRRELEGELAAALQRKDFFLEYQPIVSLEDGTIAGLEALLRWRHPDLGLVSPTVFIPVAIASPVVHQLGYWVIERTCQQIRRWQDNLSPRRVPPVAINVAGRQLFHREFPQRLAEILERTGVAGSQIRLDIPETDLMTDPPSAEGVLTAIHGMGVQVAVDDFGTGYSSLSLLHCLPVHALKIDRSFVSRPEQPFRKGGVARTIVMLAQNLDIDVIAEGIETKQQFLHLRSTGCTYAQGFFFSGPVGPPEAEVMIRDGYTLSPQVVGAA